MNTIKTKQPYQNNLRLYRKAMGFRKKEVSELLGLTDKATITQWEKGHALPDLFHFFMLCALYRIRPEDCYSELVYEIAAKSEQEMETRTLPVIDF